VAIDRAIADAQMDDQVIEILFDERAEDQAAE